MSLSSYRSTVNRLQKEIADLQNKASQLVRQQADIQKQVGREQSSLSRCKSLSQASSVQQKIANLRGKAAQLEKSESEIRNKIAGKQKDLDTYQDRLQREISLEQKNKKKNSKKHNDGKRKFGIYTDRLTRQQPSCSSIFTISQPPRVCLSLFRLHLLSTIVKFSN